MLGTKMNNGLCGQPCKSSPCIHTLETGKHEYNCLTWQHYPNAPVFIPFCSTCGWVDVSRIFNELSLKQRLLILFNKLK